MQLKFTMRPHCSPPLCRKRPAGFTLVEVLVAILVFSIGLLGVAGLLVSVIGRNQSSVYHSVAVSLANDIAERIRANRLAFGTTISDNQYTTLLSTAAPSAATSCAGSTAICDPATMAKFDASAWETLVSNVLPHGKGIVCFDSSTAADDGTLKADGSINASGCDSAGTSVVIKVLWDETRSGGRADASGNTQRYVVVFRP